MFKKKKLESRTGRVVDDVKFYAADRSPGKKAFAFFSIFVEGRQNAIYKISAFDKMAEQVCLLQDGNMVTVSISPSDSRPGEWILESYAEAKEGSKVVRKQQLLTDDGLKAKNKELEKSGVALVPIKVDDNIQYVLKDLSETIIVEGRRYCKMEFIMDRLGPELVTKVLREKAGPDIKFTADYRNKVIQAKNELLKKALEVGTVQ